MKSFAHQRVTRDADGKITGHKESPVHARTTAALGGNYGTDKDKRLIVTLRRGDLICLRPERTQREVCILAVDVYSYVLRIEASKSHLERARAAKARKAVRLAAERQKRAEKKLFRK